MYRCDATWTVVNGWCYVMLKKPSTNQDDRTIFKSFICQTHCMQYVNGWVSDVEQPNPTRLTTELHQSVPFQKHVLICIIRMELSILLIYITFLGKLICEHCKFEQMKRTFGFVTVHTYFSSYCSCKLWLDVLFIMRCMREPKMKLMIWFYWKLSDSNPQP